MKPFLSVLGAAEGFYFAESRQIIYQNIPFNVNVTRHLDF